MADFPIALVIGSVMILLGTAVAIWIAVSIIRQNRSDQIFPD